MGKTLAVLAETDLPPREAHNSRVFVDLCENVHIHHREWRQVFSLPEFFELMARLREAENDLRAYLKQNPDYEEGAYPTTLMIAGCGTKPMLEHSPAPNESAHFPRRFAIELQEPGHWDEVHVHWRDHRFVLPRTHFRRIAEVFAEALAALPAHEVGYPDHPRRHRTVEEEARRKAKRKPRPGGMGGVEDIPVDEITPRERPPRDSAWVRELVQRYRNGDPLPPIVVSSDRRVVDGNHRLTAAKQAGRDTIPAVVAPIAFAESKHLRAAEQKAKLFDRATGGRFQASTFFRDWLAWTLGTHWRGHFRRKVGR